MARWDVVVVGGGVIGLSVAWRAAQHGLRVVVLDAGPERRASAVAAGMLAPVSEADPTEPELGELCRLSAARWPRFAADLEDASGASLGYRTHGTLFVALDRDQAEALEREHEMRRRLGMNVARLTPSEARALEPGLAPAVRAALDIPGDHSVDPRAVCTALTVAAERAGVTVLPDAEVIEVASDPHAVRGAVLDTGERVLGEQTVIAAGAWSALIRGIPPDAHVPLRPIKGQILSLSARGAPRPVDRILRWGPPNPGYLVPRDDGRVVVGATMEERGFELAPTGLGVYELLRDAIACAPGIGDLAVDAVGVGLRPTTPDNCPVIGATAVAGLCYATGHFRHGVLLAPVTAELVAAELAGLELTHSFGLDRFSDPAFA